MNSRRTDGVPAHLSDYADLYSSDPLGAAKQWFRDARLGLFIHYGLYSLLANHEWVQLRQRIPVAEYAQLAHYFRADAFAAERIADFAVECGMRYINITTRHHDSFCLFETAETTFHAGNTPCGRDLVAELADACRTRGLGLCLYYSHGRDWKHPHAPNNDRWGGSARPDYKHGESAYATGEAHDLSIYVEFMRRQIVELLTNYGPIAAIWLDGIATPLHPKDASGDEIADFDPRTDGDAFDCQDLYDLIHELQPHCLVSYKQGYLGTEDFYAPEHAATNRFGQTSAEVPGEVCTTTTERAWGYTAGARWISADDAYAKYASAREAGYNLLINIGPEPDGSFPQEGEQLLRRLASRIAQHGDG